MYWKRLDFDAEIWCLYWAPVINMRRFWCGRGRRSYVGDVFRRFLLIGYESLELGNMDIFL